MAEKYHVVILKSLLVTSLHCQEKSPVSELGNGLEEYSSLSIQIS